MSPTNSPTRGFFESKNAFQDRLTQASEVQKSAAISRIMNLSAKIISKAAEAKANVNMPEGVFRTTPLSKVELGSISDEDISKGTFNGKAIDLNTYAALMKSACQENPGLLATKEDQQKLMATARLDEKDRKAAIQDILSARTPENATRDLVVKSMLAIRSENKQSGSRMDVENLATMLAPNMLDSVAPAEYAKSVALCNSIAENVLDGALEKQRAMKPVQQEASSEASLYSSPQDALGQTADESGYEIPVSSSLTTVQAPGAADGEYVTAINRGPDTGRKPFPRAVAPNLSDVSVTSEPEAVRPPMPIPSEADSGVGLSNASGEPAAPARKPMPTPTPRQPKEEKTDSGVVSDASVASSASKPKELPTPRPRPSAETREGFKVRLDGILAAGPRKPGAATTEVNQGRT